MQVEVNIEFQKVKERLEKQFGSDIDLQGILFLVGVQELGKGKIKLSKNEKLDIIHIAICTLLEPFGFYTFKGLDEQGWPHWETNEKLPPLKPMQQEQFVKQALVDYFKSNELL